ncbi:MAG: tRNA ((37)-N6)-dimethylallyltransferase MiaA, partial [Bacteroidota bacterium]
MAPKWLIVVGGATATGKTALAIELAKAYGTAVVSADSRQVFTELDIGAAKATSEELAMVPHFLINHLSVSQDYSVGDYERDALACLNAIFREKDIAILAGGSGLYIKAVCDGLDSFPEVSDEVRQQVESGEQIGGLAWLQYQLQEVDPGYYETVDRNNPARLRRALEVCLQTGKPYSSFRTGARAERPFKTLYILLDMPREQLYRRI